MCGAHKSLTFQKSVTCAVRTQLSGLRMYSCFVLILVLVMTMERMVGDDGGNGSAPSWEREAKDLLGQLTGGEAEAYLRYLRRLAGRAPRQSQQKA